MPTAAYPKSNRIIFMFSPARVFESRPKNFISKHASHLSLHYNTFCYELQAIK